MAKPQHRNQSALPRASISSTPPRSAMPKALGGALREAVGAADVAAVLLRLKPAGERDLVNRVKAMAGIGAGRRRGA